MSSSMVWCVEKGFVDECARYAILSSCPIKVFAIYRSPSGELTSSILREQSDGKILIMTMTHHPRFRWEQEENCITTHTKWKKISACDAVECSTHTLEVIELLICRNFSWGDHQVYHQNAPRKSITREQLYCLDLWQSHSDDDITTVGNYQN